MPPAIPLRARLAGLGLLAILIIHLSAVKVAPDSTYAQKTQIWKGSGSSTSSSYGGGIVEEQYTSSKPKHNTSSSSTTSSNTVSAHPPKRANAAFVILARNSDLWPIMESIRSVEDRFNSKYNYPYVFLNDKPFDDNFKKMTSGIASGKTSYGLIPEEHWSKHPSWIDEERATKAREEMAKNNVIYGDSVPYREMCRYQSGFFYRHELLKDYDWYWRVEPSVKFFCDIDYDPFMYMQENKMQYGFTISIYEYIETIPSLWETTKNFIKEYPHLVPKKNAMAFLSDDGGETYNRCHFWSNFEIANLKLWRSEAYTKYFDYLDKAGGFFYERWGDAPVHSIAAALFLPFEQIHFFESIGYFHAPFSACPKGDIHKNRCYCNPEDNFNEHWYSCTPKFIEAKKQSLIKDQSVFNRGRLV